MKPESNRGGFTLLEMVAVVGIMALIVGIAFPLAEYFLRSRMLSDTREEMTAVRDAILEYYHDVEAFPTTLDQLIENDPPADEWMGPYLPLEFTDSAENQDDYRYDAWRNPYQYTIVSATLRRLRSFGMNRTDDGGTEDDIVLDVDATIQARAITRTELEIINTAIVTYNADFLFSNPLSTDYPTLLGQLQAAGYLPPDPVSTQRYLLDGWGQEYVTNGTTPVVEVQSSGSP